MICHIRRSTICIINATNGLPRVCAFNSVLACQPSMCSRCDTSGFIILQFLKRRAIWSDGWHRHQVVAWVISLNMVGGEREGELASKSVVVSLLANAGRGLLAPVCPRGQYGILCYSLGELRPPNPQRNHQTKELNCACSIPGVLWECGSPSGPHAVMCPLMLSHVSQVQEETCDLTFNSASSSGPISPQDISGNKPLGYWRES